MPAPALSQGATQASARSRQISVIRTSGEMVLQTVLVIVTSAKEVCSGHLDAQSLICKEKHLFAHDVGTTLAVQAEGNEAAPAAALVSPPVAAPALQWGRPGPHAAPRLPLQSLGCSSGTELCTVMCQDEDDSSSQDDSSSHAVIGLSPRFSQTGEVKSSDNKRLEQ